MGQQENSEESTINKISLDIDKYRDKNKALIIQDTKSLREAEQLKKSVSKLKGLADSETKIEWEEKKKAYDDYRLEHEPEINRLKKEYTNFRDKRNNFIKSCEKIYHSVKDKINAYQLEQERKEELRIKEAKRKKEEALKAEEQAKINENASKVQDTQEEVVNKEKAAGNSESVTKKPNPGEVIDVESKTKTIITFCKAHQIEYPATMDYCPECATLTPEHEKTEKLEPKCGNAEHERVSSDIMGPQQENKPVYTMNIIDMRALFDYIPESKNEAFKAAFPYEEMKKFLSFMDEIIKKMDYKPGDLVPPGCEIVEKK
jgi:hypothetical protein